MTLGRPPIQRSLRQAVYQRDGFRCVAPTIDESVDGCRDFFGQPVVDSGLMPFGVLTLDHVKDQPMLGKRAPDDRAHLATVCWHHHLDGWATANRPALREYLRRVEGEQVG